MTKFRVRATPDLVNEKVRLHLSLPPKIEIERERTEEISTEAAKNLIISLTESLNSVLIARHNNERALEQANDEI